MSELTEQEQYQKDYDEAAAKLDAAEQVKPEAITATEPEKELANEAKPDETPDPLKELRDRLEKAEKAARDNQAWGTKNAQELATLRREREMQQRESTKPAILDANPELADAIRHVVSDPAPQQAQESKAHQWQEIVQKAHPGIFDVSIDPELETALLAKRESLGAEWFDPLVAIREITTEKLAHAERQVGKRFAVESAKLAQKSAMSVPGSGGGASRAPVDSDLEAVQRIQKMSDAEFQKEIRRVKGY